MGRPKGSKNKSTLAEAASKAAAAAYKPSKTMAEAASEAAAAAYQSFSSPIPASTDQREAIKLAATPPFPKRRGRPPGSKNKPKGAVPLHNPTAEQIIAAAAQATPLSLAKVGMTALIDEATKYQEERPKDALAQKLEEYEHPIATKIVIEVRPIESADFTQPPPPDYLDLIYKETAKEVEKMRGYFRAPDYQLPERLVNKLDAILKAKDSDEAQRLAKKALDSIHLNFCYEWAHKNVSGPLRPDTAEALARKAEQLADFLKRDGQDDNAATQRERARLIREEVKEQRGNDDGRD